MAPAGARGMVQTALESRKVWALQLVRSAAAGWRMAPLHGAEWRRGWTGAACWRRKHRCNLFCCSTRLLLYPLRPPAPRVDELGFIHSTRANTVLLSRGVDEHRLMHAGAEPALQDRSGSRSIVSRSPCTIQQPGPAVKARTDREMQLTAELGSLLLAISGAFADARSANMAAAEATWSPR